MVMSKLRTGSSSNPRSIGETGGLRPPPNGQRPHLLDLRRLSRAGARIMKLLAATLIAWSILLAAIHQSSYAAVPPPPVRGGVTFRTDDNGSAEYWKARAAAFAPHGIPFTAAVNLVNAESSQAHIDTFRSLQAAGHELADHSPSHSTIWIRFWKPEDIEWARSHPGVDHWNDKIALLKYRLLPTPADRPVLRAKVSGKELIFADPAAAGKVFRDVFYVRFPETGEVFATATRSPANGRFKLLSPWEEDTVDLGERDDVAVQLVLNYELQPTTEAIDLLAESVRRVFDRHGLRRPVSFVSPGNPPRLTREVAKATYGDKFGYRTAAIYPRSVERVFNEPDPDGDAAFAMQWGDIADEKISLEDLKTRTANLLAQNKVVIIGSHTLKTPAEWEPYFQKLGAFAQWLRETGIPVKSQAEWADALYRPVKPLEGNVFPSLERDLDGNGQPDGFESGPGVQWETLPDDAPAEAGRRGAVIPKAGQRLRVRALGGLPKGKARWSLWCHGQKGMKLDLRALKIGTSSFVLEKDGWQEVVFGLNIPADAVVARFDVDRSDSNPGPLWVGAITLQSEP